MKTRLLDTQLGLRNSTTRIAFRYGNACLTRCPQAVLRAEVECDGRRLHGYAGDCLPPSWFDKSPAKNFARQIEEMLAVAAEAAEICRIEFESPRELFPGWLAAHEQMHARGQSLARTPLLSSFGLSLVERAMMDAMCRAAGTPFAAAARANLFALDAGAVHPMLQGLSPADWLPEQPSRKMWVRHTVGLADPLTEAEVGDLERPTDSFPFTLEQYIERTGARYFKIKVSNRLDADMARLSVFAALVEKHRGADYRITLDGNEQYKTADEFDALIDAIESDSGLRTLWENTLLIEQPFERSIALSREHTSGVRNLSDRKPVIIDESDGDLQSFAEAIELGYRGVSSKNCKGPIKSLLNAGLVWRLNSEKRGGYLMTGEDLCSVGVIPVQADLCLVATLGLDSVERNGHHYHPGLNYLSRPQQQAALAAHGDFYHRVEDIVAPHLRDGAIEIGSIVDCAGFGFDVEPEMTDYQTAEEWDFASLGLNDLVG